MPPRERNDEPTVKVEQPQRAAIVPRPKKPPARSEKYLDFVRALACCVCSAPAPSDPHHFGPHGMGQKTDDYRTVPLCREHHDEFHLTHKIARLGDVAETTVFFLRCQVSQLIAWITMRQGA